MVGRLVTTCMHDLAQNSDDREGSQTNASMGAGRDLNSNQAWSCVDVYVALCRLADVGHLEGVTGILKGPLTACPELVLLGLAAAAPGLDRRTLQARVAQPLALRFASQAAQGSPASQALMHKLRDVNGELLQTPLRIRVILSSPLTCTPLLVLLVDGRQV